MSSNATSKNPGYLGERLHLGELDYYQMCETIYFMSRVEQAARLIKQR